MRSLICCLVLFVVGCPQTQDPSVDRLIESSDSNAVAASEIISEAIGAGLQGDARTALARLHTIDPSDLNQREREYLSCMLQRFDTSGVVDDPQMEHESLAARVIEAYTRYWRSALLEPENRQAHTQELERRLRTIIGLSPESDTVQIENTLREALRADGLYTLLGQTGVLRELMIWRQEDRQSITVEMPHGVYTTRVAFLDNFLIAGWGRFATCDARGAGGWVADRTLFAVVPAYDDLESEEFKVTFLAHETQHYLDLEAYADITPWELEYRAKLIELAMADETQPRVLQKFIEDQGNDPASPHSYANKRLLRQLQEQLPVSEIHDVRSADPQSDSQYGLRFVYSRFSAT